MELLNQLTSKLGISEDQAKGGLGALGNFAKDKLPADMLSKLTEAVPGLSGMMSEESDGSGGGLGGMVSGLAGGIGGKLGGMAESAGLLGKLSSLGLSQEQISGFIEQVGEFLKSKGLGGVIDQIKG